MSGGVGFSSLHTQTIYVLHQIYDLSVHQDCTHNSTGTHCDQCLPGFYGDAREGTADDCQVCPCPLTEPSNRFEIKHKTVIENY